MFHKSCPKNQIPIPRPRPCNLSFQKVGPLVETTHVPSNHPHHVWRPLWSSSSFHPLYLLECLHLQKKIKDKNRVPPGLLLWFCHIPTSPKKEHQKTTCCTKSPFPASKLGNPSGPIGAIGRLGAVTCNAGCVCTARGNSNGAVGEGWALSSRLLCMVEAVSMVISRGFSCNNKLEVGWIERWVGNKMCILHHIEMYICRIYDIRICM